MTVHTGSTAPETPRAFDALADALRADGAKVQLSLPLSGVSWYRIGGPADLFVEPRSAGALSRVLRRLQEAGLPVFVMGDGSNLLFDDAGFRGAVVRIGRGLGDLHIDRDTGRVQAGAGLWVPHFARKLGLAGLSGLEHIVGIPGTLGGLVAMNGGSQRKGVGDHTVTVSGVRRDGNPFTLTRAQCAFAYRRSALQDGDSIVTQATFQLNHRPRDAMLRDLIAIMVSRRGKFPKQYPNCGSVFLSNPAMYEIVGPPGRAIENVGLKGERRGNAQLSPQHANFIINLGGARSADVLALIAMARHRVEAETGYAMDCEVIHVRPEDGPVPAHVSAVAQADTGRGP